MMPELTPQSDAALYAMLAAAGLTLDELDAYVAIINKEPS